MGIKLRLSSPLLKKQFGASTEKYLFIDRHFTLEDTINPVLPDCMIVNFRFDMTFQLK